VNRGRAGVGGAGGAGGSGGGTGSSSGVCVRGWLTFEVPAGERPVAASFSSSSTVEWTIPPAAVVAKVVAVGRERAGVEQELAKLPMQI
jgi:hypothetical protein